MSTLAIGTATSTDLQGQYRSLMGDYPTGVCVITAGHGEERFGMVVNSMASVSMDPPILSWSIDFKSSNFENFSRCNSFVVNVLSADQAHLSKQFSAKGIDRFTDVDLDFSELGNPAIRGCLGTFEATVGSSIDVGDHRVFFGEVIRVENDTTRSPLLYHQRNVGQIPTEFYSKTR